MTFCSCYLQVRTKQLARCFLLAGVGPRVLLWTMYQPQASPRPWKRPSLTTWKATPRTTYQGWDKAYTSCSYPPLSALWFFAHRIPFFAVCNFLCACMFQPVSNMLTHRFKCWIRAANGTMRLLSMRTAFLMYHIDSYIRVWDTSHQTRNLCNLENIFMFTRFLSRANAWSYRNRVDEMLVAASCTCCGASGCLSA